MNESEDTNSKSNAKEWSDQKKWVMGLVATAIIGLGAAGWKFLANHLSSPTPVPPRMQQIEFVASNLFDSSVKGLVKGRAWLKGNEVTVNVDLFQIQNASPKPIEVLGLQAVFMRPVTKPGESPAGERSPQVVIGKAIPAGKTVSLQPFTTIIELNRDQTVGAWLSFTINFPPISKLPGATGEEFLPLQTAPGLF